MTAEVLAAYPGLSGARVTPLEGGLINRTYRVEAASGTFILQSLHPIFKSELHEDIEAITSHLAKKGMVTPRLVRTSSNGLFHVDPAGQVWRVMTYVDAKTYQRFPSAHIAEAAGELVGRFHQATADLQHTFRFTRAGVHDTTKHLATLQKALADHTAHRAYHRVLPLAQEIQTRIAALPPIVGAPRIVHGDLKVSNLLFKDDKGVCLVDLDTMAYMPLAHEMGDAWRSWCNPVGEDSVDTRFDLGMFSASARGYFRVNPVKERAELVTGIEAIALELAARFAADALNEAYFGWNEKLFPDRSTHNAVRAEGQLALARSIAAQRADILAAVEAA